MYELGQFSSVIGTDSYPDCAEGFRQLKSYEVELWFSCSSLPPSLSLSLLLMWSAVVIWIIHVTSRLVV